MKTVDLLVLIALTTGTLSCTSQGQTEQSYSPTADYRIELETVTRGGDAEGRPNNFIWTQARAAWIPTDLPYALMTMSQKLKTGDDVYYDLYQTLSYDSGQTWSTPAVIPSLKLHAMEDGYRRSMSDMTPMWHESTGKVLNIGKSFFYTDDSNPDRSRREVAYAVYDPTTRQWGEHQALTLPELDHDSLYLSAPTAGCVQWIIEPNGDILLPIFYYKMTPEQKARTQRDAFDVGNNMNSDDLGQTITVVRCRFDGKTLTYVEHGNELELKQGRGLGEPSLAHFRGTYFLTLRSDQTAYVTQSADGLHFDPIREWTFDDGKVLGSYNTQQHWATFQDQLYLVYTRRGVNNKEVFRHRAPLLMAEVNPEKLIVLRATERAIVPNRGVGLGNFGVTAINERQVWVTTTEYMRGETKVKADNSVFVARLLSQKSP